MKTANKLLMGLGLLSVAFISCDDDDDSISFSTAEKLQNKWQVETVSARYVSPTRDTTATYSGLPTDSYDFRPDGSVVYSIFGTTDTLNYTILSDEYLLVDGDSAQIQTLTTNQLQVKSKEQLSDTTYNEITAKLVR